MKQLAFFDATPGPFPSPSVDQKWKDKTIEHQADLILPCLTAHKISHRKFDLKDAEKACEMSSVGFTAPQIRAAIDNLCQRGLLKRWARFLYALPEFKEKDSRSSGPTSPEVKIVRNYDPKEKDHWMGVYREEPHRIDSALEIVNATTDLME